jgi:hypothetical protein
LISLAYVLQAGFNVLNAVELSKEVKLEQLSKVLESQALHGSESLKAFLRFVVLKAIENHDVSLKEYTIATEVFGRNSNYDPRNDSVVRVQASRLRSKLQEYYATEGKSDKIIIELPKGGYLPNFALQAIEKSFTELPQIELSAKETEGQAIQSGSDPRQANWVKWSIVGLLIVAGLLAAATIYYRAEATKPREPLPTASNESAQLQAAAPLWNEFLQPSEPILVSFSNTKFEGTAETGMKILNPIVATAKTDAPKNAADSNRVITEHYTGIGEVMGVYALADFFSRARYPFKVKRSLLLTWDDLKSNNIVILGSSAENYLLRDLPQQQDFVFGVFKDESGNLSFGLTNTKAKAGEEQFYFAKQEGPSRSQISEDYALISVLKGLDADHRLMILGGITTYGTQAAAEYVSKPEHIKELISHLNVSSNPDTPKLPAYYQIVIKVKVNGGVPVQIAYVTHHVL